MEQRGGGDLQPGPQALGIFACPIVVPFAIKSCWGFIIPVERLWLQEFPFLILAFKIEEEIVNK